HLLDSGETGAAKWLATDANFLTRVCVELGVDNLEAQLAGALDRAVDPDLVFERLLTALRSCRATLRAHPDDLPSILPNALAATLAGTEWSAVDALVRTSSGRPFLRAERSIDVPVGAVSVTRDRRFTACAAVRDIVMAGTDRGEVIEYVSRDGHARAPAVM